MALLSGFRAEQLIRQLSSEQDINSVSAKKTVEKLKKLGAGIIPKLFDALAMSDKSQTMAFVDILTEQLNDKTLSKYKEGLADGAERVVSGTAWALSSSTDYDPTALLEFFDDPEVAKGPLIEILKVHKKQISLHELMRRAYEVEPKEKAALFKIIEDIITEDMVPDLINRLMEGAPDEQPLKEFFLGYLTGESQFLRRLARAHPGIIRALCRMDESARSAIAVAERFGLPDTAKEIRQGLADSQSGGAS